MSLSKRPVASRSEMMIGLDVAPVAPFARLVAISTGSTESSHSLVPHATRDWSGVMVGLRGMASLLDDTNQGTHPRSNGPLRAQTSTQMKPDQKSDPI